MSEPVPYVPPQSQTQPPVPPPGTPPIQQTPEQVQREIALANVLTILNSLEAYTTGAMVTHQALRLDVPPTLSALPDAVTKVGLALGNLQDVIVQCRDIAMRGNPVGYGLPTPPPPVEPPPPPPQEPPPDDDKDL
jgi:hypothetical protein